MVQYDCILPSYTGSETFTEEIGVLKVWLLPFLLDQGRLSRSRTSETSSFCITNIVVWFSGMVFGFCCFFLYVSSCSTCEHQLHRGCVSFIFLGIIITLSGSLESSLALCCFCLYVSVYSTCVNQLHRGCVSIIFLGITLAITNISLFEVDASSGGIPCFILLLGQLTFDWLDFGRMSYYSSYV